MCGIAAFLSSDKRISTERLKRATNSLHHRGPDSQGVWLSPNQRVGLGHARLNIIDLATGDQPIANENERGPIAEISVEGFDRTIALLLRGPFLGIKYAVPHMQGGSIINIASVAGLAGGYAPPFLFGSEVWSCRTGS